MQNVEKRKKLSRAWFRSTDLWVMGPARFHCATLLSERGSGFKQDYLFSNENVSDAIDHRIDCN